MNESAISLPATVPKSKWSIKFVKNQFKNIWILIVSDDDAQRGTESHVRHSKFSILRGRGKSPSDIVNIFQLARSASNLD